LETFGSLENWSLKRGGLNRRFNCILHDNAFLRSTLLLIPDSLDQSSVYLYPSNLTVFIFVMTRFLCSLSRAKKSFCNNIPTRFGKKKIKEVLALDVAGSILVQKYHAEFGEAA